jgi:starch phosphorylase
MNEGHSSLLTLELLQERLNQKGRTELELEDREAVRKQCVFTTHTPVPAGHDQIFSHYINGVAKKHGEISRHMFAPYDVDSITNGVRPQNWVSKSFAKLFDLHIPGWRQDNFSLRYALGIPNEDIWDAHQRSKHVLIEYANREVNAGFDRDFLTIGFARRAALYKRADLVFEDIQRLKKIARDGGNFQLVFAGKAHPQNQEGIELIQRIFQIKNTLRDEIPIAYLPNYDMNLGRLMTAGVDVWLNTPQSRPWKPQKPVA